MITPTPTSIDSSAPSHHDQPRAHRSARSVSLAAGLLCGLVGGMAMTASAQTAPPPPPDPALTAPPAHVTIYHESLGWTFEPIVTNGLIVGVFAHINDDLAFANNVDTVWIEAPSGEEWVVWGWRKGTSRLSAAMAIREAWNDETILQESPVLLAELEQLELNNLGEGYIYDDPSTWPGVEGEGPASMDEGAIGGTPAEQILAVLPDPITAQLLAQVGQDVAPGLSALMVTSVPSSDFPCEDGGGGEIPGEVTPYETPEGDPSAYQVEQPMTQFGLLASDVADDLADAMQGVLSPGLDQAGVNCAGLCVPETFITKHITPWTCTVSPPVGGAFGACTYGGCTRVIIVETCKLSLTCKLTCSTTAPVTEMPPALGGVITVGVPPCPAQP